MNAASTLLDPYSLRARLQPALLALLPFVVTAFTLAPSASQPMHAALVIIATAGGAVWLSQVARDLGKELEPRLYASWGGKPSTAMLRHRDNRLSAALKARYRAALGGALNLRMPTDTEEQVDPEAADVVYATAGAWLVANTHSTEEFRVLFADNINYGFRRNLLGLKPFAVGGALLSAALVAICWRYGWPLPQPSAASVQAGLCSVTLYLLLMLFVVRPTWVKRAADAYAERLLETTDRLLRR